MKDANTSTTAAHIDFKMRDGCCVSFHDEVPNGGVGFVDVMEEVSSLKTDTDRLVSTR